MIRFLKTATIAVTGLFCSVRPVYLPVNADRSAFAKRRAAKFYEFGAARVLYLMSDAATRRIRELIRDYKYQYPVLRQMTESQIHDPMFRRVLLENAP